MISSKPCFFCLILYIINVDFNAAIAVQSFADLVSEHSQTEELTYGSPKKDFSNVAAPSTSLKDDTIREENSQEMSREGRGEGDSDGSEGVSYHTRQLVTLHGLLCSITHGYGVMHPARAQALTNHV